MKKSNISPYLHLAPKLRKRTRGQSLILVALMMFVLLGIVGLAVDGGSSYERRRTAQNAADGAAMAGTRVMLTHYEDMMLRTTADEDSRLADGVEEAIKLAIDNYLRDNGALTDQNEITAYFVNDDRQVVTVGTGRNGSCGFDVTPVVPCEVGDNLVVPWSIGAKGIVVKGKARTDSYLMKLFGYNTVEATAEATAFMGVALNVNAPLLPVAFSNANGLDGVALGQTYNLINGDSRLAPGNWGYIAFNGNHNASDTDGMLKCGYNASIETQNPGWQDWCRDRGFGGDPAAMRADGQGPTIYQLGWPTPNGVDRTAFAIRAGKDPVTSPRASSANWSNGWWLQANTGVARRNCRDLQESVEINTQFIIPIIDAEVGTGSNVLYHLRDLGLFTITSVNIQCTRRDALGSPYETWFIEGRLDSQYIAGSSGANGELRSTSFRQVFLER